MWYLAIKHLMSRPGQTVILLAGIMLGSAGYVMFSGLQTGQEEFMIDRLVNVSGCVTISPRERFITPGTFESYFFTGSLVRWLSPPSGRKDRRYLDNPAAWYRRLASDPAVLAYAPRYTINAILRKGAVSRSVTLNGVEPESQSRVTNIEQDITAGSLSSLGRGSSSILVSEELARVMGIRLGRSITVVAEDGSVHPVKVTGLFNTGAPRLDQSTAYTSLSTAQRIGKSAGRITSIIVKVKDVYASEAVSGALSLHGDDKVESWARANENVLSMLNTQRAVKNATMLVIVTVVSFGIYNILSMVVNQKKKDIAILRSMGFDRNHTVFLFLVQGVILGMIGSVLGLALGAAGCVYMSTIKVGIGRGYMTISWDPMIYVTAFTLVVVSAVVSSFLPARMAGKLSPIDIIRGA